MILLKDIIEAYKSARKNKRKSADAVEFELHWQANCVQLYDNVINHTHQPTTYAFVVSHPKYREIMASDMSTRVLHHYLGIRLQPILESVFSPHTYNNRKGYGTTACQNAVINNIYNVSNGFTKDAWIIKIDLKGCFPNIVQDVAYNQIKLLIDKYYHGYDKEELYYILSICIYSYPTLHCTKKSFENWDKIPKEKSLFNKPLGIGAAIGHWIWQSSVNYYFNEIDTWISDLGISYERFVDDIYIVTDNKDMCLSYIIPELRQRLQKLGARLNENKHYCQHYTKGCECLGIHIKMDRLYINNRIIKSAKKKIPTISVCINNINNFISVVNSYLGRCKGLTAYRKALEIINTIDIRWFKYVYYDISSMTLKAREKYSFNNILKCKYYDKNRKRKESSSYTRAIT